MSELPEEPILDACLDELLGGQRPPDLTQQILRAHQQDESARRLEVVVPAPPSAHESGAGRSGDRSTGRRAEAWIGLAVSAAILLVGTSAGLLALRWTAPEAPALPVADRPDTEPTDTEPMLADTPEDSQPVQPQLDQAELTDSPFAFDSQPEPPLERGVETPPATTRSIVERAGPSDLPGADPQQTTPVALELAEVVRRLEAEAQQAWDEAGLQPAASLAEADWREHIFRRLLGRSPRAEELVRPRSEAEREFQQPDPLVVRICTSPAYADEFAKYWAQRWADALLLGQRAGRAQESALVGFLEESLRGGDSFADTVTKLLAAQGSSTAGDEFNGATNYVLAHHQGEAHRLTAHVGRMFLGRRFECARCHDHPTDAELTQDTFWELNATFRQLRVRKTDAGHRVFDATQGRTKAIFYETPSGEMKAAFPALPGSTPLLPAQLTAANRRELLAQQLVGTDKFSQAVANRTWGMLFGYPLVDFGGESPGLPPHHAMLELLADQFVARDYDFGTLVASIASSSVFRLGDAVATDDQPAMGDRPLFSRRYSPQPDPAKLSDLLVAFRDTKVNSMGPTAARLAPNQGLPADSLAVPSQESPLAGIRLSRGARQPSQLVGLVLAAELPNDSKLSHLFWATLNRSPNNRERRLAEQVINNTADSQTAWLDIWWAIARSQEAAALRNQF